MAANLVSAKVSVFTARSYRLHPSLPKCSTWHKHQLKYKTTANQRLDELFITKQDQKAKKKNKIGLPPNKQYRLTPLARHDDFNDAHIKDKN